MALKKKEVRIKQPHNWIFIIIANIIGISISIVDNFASGGEVSPNLIIALTASACFVLGFINPKSSWLMALCSGSWVPAVYLVKHILGLPHALNPNTYSSIMQLFVFMLFLSFITAFTGAGIRSIFNKPR